MSEVDSFNGEISGKTKLCYMKMNKNLIKQQVTLVAATRLTLDCIYLGIISGSAQDSLWRTVAESIRPCHNHV